MFNQSYCCCGGQSIHCVNELFAILYFQGEYTNHLIPFHWEFAAYIFQPLTLEFWIVWVQKNKECMLFAGPASMLQKQFSRQGFHRVYFEIPQEFWILLKLHFQTGSVNLNGFINIGFQDGFHFNYFLNIGEPNLARRLYSSVLSRFFTQLLHIAARLRRKGQFPFYCIFALDSSTSVSRACPVISYSLVLVPWLYCFADT